MTVFQGQQLNISCKVMAYPAPRVAWANNQLSSDFTTTRDPSKRDVIISSSKIEITKAMTSGVYEVKATNSAGSASREIEITVMGNCFMNGNKTMHILSFISLDIYGQTERRGKI